MGGSFIGLRGRRGGMRELWCGVLNMVRSPVGSFRLVLADGGTDCGILRSYCQLLVIYLLGAVAKLLWRIRKSS
jgi:hypothetical protein